MYLVGTGSELRSILLMVDLPVPSGPINVIVNIVILDYAQYGRIISNNSGIENGYG